MTQDANLLVREQGAWLTLNLGTADQPKIMKLKIIPADFDEMNRINSKIVEMAKPLKGKENVYSDAFATEVVGLIAPHVVDWNLVDDKGKIDCDEENKRRQLGRFLIAFVTPDPAEGVPIVEGAKPERKSALTMIMDFLGDYSNFLEA